jgi:tRNA dimethylallyltransferase
VSVLYLVGPTAVGKTAVAHMLGRRVVSADSMQVYRGMDIGTAKDKRAALVDVCDITEQFDVKRFVELATPLLPGAVVVGGTGLYIRALRQGLFEGPGRNEELRVRLEAMPAEKLFAQLRRLDPKAAKDIDPNNPRRLVRALEVFYATGKSIRDFQNQKFSDDLIFGLNRPREDLYRRIEQRVDEQIAAGWVDEVRRLISQGFEHNRTAMQAAGYRELVQYLHGRLSLTEAVARIKTRTRQLARRQLTWFRREPGVEWMEVAADESPAVTATRIVEKLPSH